MENKKEKPKKLWNKLKQFLMKEKKFECPDQIYFDNLFIKSSILENNKKYLEYKYIDKTDQELQQAVPIQVKIFDSQKVISLTEINKFNRDQVDSTGINLWPAEEVLAYFIIKRIDTLRNFDRFIELGAGYSGLASLVLIKMLEQQISDQNQIQNKYFNITDGNEICAQQLNENISMNLQNINYNLKVQQLIWSESFTIQNENEKYDCVFIADCLFFKEFHEALITTIDQLLKCNGYCIIVAPKRGDSFLIFISKLQQNQNLQHEIFEFNDQAYLKSIQTIQSKEQVYDEDRHKLNFIKIFKKNNNQNIIF